MAPMVDKLHMSLKAEVKLYETFVSRAFDPDGILGFGRSLEKYEIRFDRQFPERTFSDIFFSTVHHKTN